MTIARRHPPGYLTLLAVLVVTALAASTVISMALFATDDILLANGVGTQYQTRALAKACAEVALQQIASDITIATGDTVIQFDEINSDCTYSIEAVTTESSEEQKIIRATGTFLPNNSKARMQITVGTGPTEVYPVPIIISWLHVADF